MNTIKPRTTVQKQAIRKAFEELDRPLSPEEALAESKKQVIGLSIATIYRNIHALVEDGWLVPVDLPGQTTRYELSGKEHHHHFQCTVCQKTFDLSGCAAPIKPRLPRGFKASSHEFFVYGSCASCA